MPALRESVDVDQPAAAHHVFLHQVEQVGAAGDPDARRRRGWPRRLDILVAGQEKAFDEHRSGREGLAFVALRGVQLQHLAPPRARSAGRRRSGRCCRS
jgi:hypothetical protein